MDYEVVKGGMDDVFLAVTGEKAREVSIDENSIGINEQEQKIVFKDKGIFVYSNDHTSYSDCSVCYISCKVFKILLATIPDMIDFG